MQQGKPILNMAASFQAPEDGVHHQEAMPDVPGPDDLKSETELRREMIDDIPEKFRRHMLRARPIEIRPVHPRSRSEEHTSELHSLMRISYAVFCLKKKTTSHYNTTN